MKRFIYGVLPVIVLALASCTLAVYVQKNNTDSSQKVENPVSTSADSASISVTLPKID